MPASVKQPSTSVANNRIRRRHFCKEKRGVSGVFVRRLVLGMRRLSTEADVNKPSGETQENSAISEHSTLPRQVSRTDFADQLGNSLRERRLKGGHHSFEILKHLLLITLRQPRLQFCDPPFEIIG